MTLEAVDTFLKTYVENDMVVMMVMGSDTPLIITAPKLSHKMNALSGTGLDRPIMVNVDHIILLTTSLDDEQ